TVYIGGLEIFKGSITAGHIAEFIIYVNLLTWPVTSVGWITSIVQRAAASQRRVNEFMHTKNDIVSIKNLQKELQGHIIFDDVSFTFPDSGTKALQNISFEVRAGESIAIIGTTGSGKSTIANLIPRMYDITGGQILVDNIDIKDYDLSN